ncbi:BspA family leucine-rich repeat surface protein [Mycoplasma putrefaciens]|uniref:PARCEL domain protein n=1 Tax=Mycoplasma putrefaciens (strain ATCC 15718 / NCTC 10155 / C30 KS-1 / KS-1) TaxID=743965 RepID=A0A7U3ZSJ4_MYCPK|nr:BspA family leucine-rich repeat surface protein [Mycoplasma putrefaciens]AEM68747.1 PARCEL domain protein [Mycoplasma putrefaciens KS1]
MAKKMGLFYLSVGVLTAAAVWGVSYPAVRNRQFIDQQEIEQNKDQEIVYLKSIWNDHFKNKSSSLDTKQDVLNNLKYVLSETRKNFPIEKIEFNQISDANKNVLFSKNSEYLTVKFKNHVIRLPFGLVNDSNRALIFKVTDQNPRAKINEIFSTLDANFLNSDWESLKYEVLQVGYFKNENKLIQIIKMPYEVKKITKNFSKAITSLHSAFSNSTANEGLKNITEWDTSNVIDMSSMFRIAKSFNQDISRWNTLRVTKMQNMFDSAEAFNQNINSKRVTINNKTYIAWSTARVTDMNSMFFKATKFNQSIANWNTFNVTNMNNMFKFAKLFNQDISRWNTSNVTSMREMFYSAEAFNQNISTKPIIANNINYTAWSTARVTDMNSMFFSAINFNQPITNWNTAKVANMTKMFSEAKNFKQDISSWNVSSTILHTDFDKDASPDWKQEHKPNFTK